MSDEVELHAAWAEVVAPGRRSDEWFDEVVGRHRQPHRRYHGVRHVVWVLRHVRELEAAVVDCAGPEYDGGAVTVAAFFHDAVYDPTASDNEERSAVLADRALRVLEWATQRRDRVVALVRATAGHLGPVTPTADATATERAVLVDADLAVLGSDSASYTAYATGVRAEYGHLPDEAWVRGRGDVLRRLLGRATLFETAPARQWWEHSARANLTAELAGLDDLSRGG